MATFLPVSCSCFDYNSDFTGSHKQEKMHQREKAAHANFLTLYTVFSIHDFDAEAFKVGFFSYLKVYDFTKSIFSFNFIFLHMAWKIRTH